MIQTPFIKVYMFPDYPILIDVDDVSKIINRSWHKFNNGNNGVYLRGWDRDLKKKIFLHRLILDAYDPKIQVDHINGKINDNRKSNLRFATIQQNITNRDKPLTNTSGYKGVFKRGDKYQASIGVNGSKIYLGIYNNPEDAALAYNKACIEYFGEFGKVNKL